MSQTLVTELRERVTILQKAAGAAQVLLAGIANPAYGRTPTIDLSRVMTSLMAAEDAAAEAIALITAAAEAAGARETAARRGPTVHDLCDPAYTPPSPRPRGGARR